MSTRDSAKDKSAVVSGGQAQAPATRDSVDQFLAQVKATPAVAKAGNGRLIFAMDATMSRQPTWDMALSLQSQMFSAVRDVGGLDVQLVYFRGFNECRASKWVSDPMALQRLMTGISVQGGRTQIGK
ncbi:MAG: VWA domain-containing protein, partial [Anderseniella sp.]|nr:VWA domain-containing protein [Anderseniella sp.]